MLLQFNPEGTYLAFLHSVANCSCSEALGTAERQLSAQQLWVADLTTSRHLWQVPVPLASRPSFSFGRNGLLLVCGPNGIWEASVEQKTAQQLYLPAAGASGVSSGVYNMVLVLLPWKQLSGYESLHLQISHHVHHSREATSGTIVPTVVPLHLMGRTAALPCLCGALEPVSCNCHAHAFNWPDWYPVMRL